MSLWGRIFASVYDRGLAAVEEAGLAERRRLLLAGARGRVLEIGGGTGANLAHYPSEVSEVVVTEPEEPMARRLEAKLGGARVPARVVRAPAERLPFGDGEFDVAVSTLVLCTVRDPARALAEVHRVLRSGGRLLFLEHVRAPDPGLARWQDRLHPLWVRVGHGCHCNRPTLDLIERSPLEIERVERGEMRKAAPFVRPLITGSAVAPS